MNNKLEKPSAEAKALSLYLMAFKKTSPQHKEKSKFISSLWNQVTSNQMDIEDYLEEVERMLAFFGGYTEVVEKTVKFYVEKSGEWKLKGDDKYSVDAKQVADRLLSK